MNLMFVNKKQYRRLCQEFKMTPIKQVEEGSATFRIEIGLVTYDLTVKPNIKKIKYTYTFNDDSEHSLPINLPEFVEQNFWNKGFNL